MKKLFFIACCAALAGCGNRAGQNADNAGMPAEAAEKYTQVNQQLNQVDALLQQGLADASIEELNRINELNAELSYTYDPQGMDSAAVAESERLRQRIARTQTAILQAMEQEAQTRVVPTHSVDQTLLEEKTTYPVYLERGDMLFFTTEAEKMADINLYNADSRKLLKSYKSKRSVSDSLAIRYNGIYLVQVTPKGRQYMDVRVGYRSATVDHMLHPRVIDMQTVEAEKSDFQATPVKGIKMKNLFEEPRKFTLRGQLKAAFSGSYRAIVAVQVPAGATDILYSLRISTNEPDRSSDGQFYDNMETSYRRVKLLGLPVYESHKGAGLIATLLGENQPLREEDAYINMYVFYNSAQAKKFQDGTDPAKLSYNVDYSTMGTQSCNGRIPSKGNKTIYLGFLNERMRYNNYVWLEAVSAVPHTEYYKTQYTLR